MRRPFVTASFALSADDCLAQRRGARVLDSFFAAGLVDYVSVSRSPATVREPESVLAGPRTRAALQAWEESLGFTAGDDHVGFGRWPNPSG